MLIELNACAKINMFNYRVAIVGICRKRKSNRNFSNRQTFGGYIEHYNSYADFV